VVQRHHLGRGRQGETPMTSNDTYAGEFYCVKCKEKREAEGKVVVSENGRRMAKATCPVCGTNLNRILGKA
jgi:hypothetical protein